MYWTLEEYTKAAIEGFLWKKLFLKNPKYRKTPVLETLAEVLESPVFSTGVFLKYCKISKNSHFGERLPMAASEYLRFEQPDIVDWNMLKKLALSKM